jgi:hypothetical protein
LREIAVFGGTAHPALAAEICADLGVPQRPVAATDDSCRVLLRPHSVNILRLETADAER